MTVKFRNYTSEPGITDDYHKVRAFFVKLGYAEYTFARWDWMITHSYLDKEAVGKIGLWEANGEIVGVATFDLKLGDAFCLALPDYKALKKEMLNYAKTHLIVAPGKGVIISDEDSEFQKVAAQDGFLKTAACENDAVFYTDRGKMTYELPKGFKIVDMKTHYDTYQYRRVLWKGFDHELDGEGPLVFTENDVVSADQEMKRANVDLSLKVAVVAPDGNFVSYCGMWYDSDAGYAVIEPVATDPEYRKLGLGKAAVLEGIKRVTALGAKRVFVGSSQQFYYSIGMEPYAKATRWKISNDI